jgi:hypothetical protein
MRNQNTANKPTHAIVARSQIWISVFSYVTIIAFTLCLFFVACDSEDDDNPPEATFQEQWFPMEIGYRWTEQTQYWDSTLYIATRTVVAESTIDGYTCYAVRYDYPPEYHEPEFDWWHVFEDSVYWPTRQYSYDFPFEENEWQHLYSIAAFDTTFTVIIHIDYYWVTTSGHSVEVIAGQFDNCWMIEDVSVSHDLVTDEIDTSYHAERSYYLARNIGWVKGYDFELISFETDIDVSDLWPMPEGRNRPRQELSITGHRTARSLSVRYLK